MLSPSEFTQYFFPPIDASTAAFSVHLSTGLTAGKIFMVGFLVVAVDGAGVVVGFNVAADGSKVWLIK